MSCKTQNLISENNFWILDRFVGFSQFYATQTQNRGYFWVQMSNYSVEIGDNQLFVLKVAKIILFAGEVNKHSQAFSQSYRSETVF
jgi:hypothetical protein